MDHLDILHPLKTPLFTNRNLHLEWRKKHSTKLKIILPHASNTERPVYSSFFIKDMYCSMEI